MNKTLSYNSRHDHSDPLNPEKFKFHSTNPSNQYRSKNYVLPETLAPFYRQNILQDNPSNVILYTGTSGISSNPRIELPNTGEYFNFLDSEANVYRDLIATSLGDLKESPAPKHEQGSQTHGHTEHKGLTPDERELFASLKAKLDRFKPRDHPCEACARAGMKSLFDREADSSHNTTWHNFTEPCPHSSLKNVPAVQPISTFDENMNSRTRPPFSKDSESNKFCRLRSNSIPNRETNSSSTGTSLDGANIDEINVDHLLTYHSEKEDSKDLKPTMPCDIYEITESKTNLNDLSPIKTSSLRTLALETVENKSLLDPWVSGEPFDIAGLSELPTISLREPNHDDKKLACWKYPECLMKQVTQEFVSPSPLKAKRLETTKQEDDSLKEIQEYLHNNDISVDFMMEKYINLRKSDGSKDALKALKHLICLKLNKQKLYYKREEENEVDQSAESMFHSIITNINRTSRLESTDQHRDDDSTLYTFSSLSLSTYDSVMENLTFAVTDNTFFYEDPDSIHANVIDAYGWLTILDEEVRNAHPQILYCELRGNKLLIHPSTFKANLKTTNPNSLLMTVKLDDTFTLFRKTNTQKNKTYLRLQADMIKPVATKADGKASKNQRQSSQTVVRTCLRVEADTQNELSNWHTFLSSRCKIGSFFTVLENHRVAPMYNTIYFLLYPKRKELIFNRLEYNHECEEEIYKLYTKNPLQYVDFSMRDMNDDDLIHHMSNWQQPLSCVNFALNKLALDFDPQMMVDYVNKTSIQRLILDKNPVEESAYSTLIPALASNTSLKYISFKGCKIFDSLIGTLKKLNKSPSQGKLVLDLRHSQTSPEFEEFAKDCPLSNLRILVQNTPGFPQEYEMEYFMDVKNLPEVIATGPLIAGRLLSTQWKTKKRFNFPFFKKEREDSYDVYFEFRAPYLAWYNWFPQKKPRFFKKKVAQNQNHSILTESDIAFVYDVKKLDKDGVFWILVYGRIPEKFNCPSTEVRIKVKGYKESSTTRWFEILRRWVAGINYVEHIERNPSVQVCKHILSFCSRLDTPELVMNGFPCDRRFMSKFLSYINGQSSLKSISFSNMGLDSKTLAFDGVVLKGMELTKLDFSFNLIEMKDEEDKWLTNALVPGVKAKHYNISHNPLGDSLQSAKLFHRTLSLEPQKLSFNHCKLSSVFLGRLTSALSKSTQKFESLEILELEGNDFSYEDTRSFIKVLVEKFPNIMDLRLEGSIPEENAKDLVKAHPICSFERVSRSEPEVGDFTRVLHVKKDKRTTRQTFMQNINNSSTQSH